MPSMSSEIQGLTQSQAQINLKTYGENAIAEVKSKTLFQKILQQFTNPLIYILLFALSIDLGIWLYEGANTLPIEAIAILIILIANAGMGIWQSLKSETALSKLKKLSAPQSWVYRDHQLQRIDSKYLVPDDIIKIKAGDRIPIDGIALRPEGFLVDESILTGESAPVDINKSQEVFSGTLAVRGTAIIKVTQTGANSNMGKLAHMLQSIDQEKTPLEKRLEVIGKRIALFVILIASTLFVIGLTLNGIDYFSKIFLFSVALAVAAVPESLPAIITLTLALGVERMAKKNAVVRKMSAVEALGSVTVIATDKTGTLTENKMHVEKLDCDNLIEAYKAMILVNDADIKTEAGDPLEIGILKYIHQQDPQLIDTTHQSYKQVSSKPFDTEWKFMRVSVTDKQQGEDQSGGLIISYLKGAPEILLERSTLNDVEKSNWHARIDEHASKGYRALGIARSEGEQETNIEWLGLILLLDPPRQEIASAIKKALDAGIRVLMVTGDHPATGQEIGRQVGIISPEHASHAVLTGKELDRLDETEFQEAIKNCNIFARVSPEHKLKIVKTLQSQDQVVAVTGDGVNDAPALKASDVGIAMGQRGSDVSREVADLVLLDDNFTTITTAIEEGRSIYENIQKTIRSLFSSNFAEVVLISIGALLAFQAAASGAHFLLPLTAAQILWINLLTDSIPALAIAADKNPSVLSFKPRSASEPLLDKDSIQFITFVGLIGSLVSLALLLLLPRYGIENNVTQTLVFCYLTVVQLTFVNPSRKSKMMPKNNPFVWGALLSALIIQGLALYLPSLRSLLGITELNKDMLLLLFITLAISWCLAALSSTYLRYRCANRELKS